MAAPPAKVFKRVFLQHPALLRAKVPLQSRLWKPPGPQATRALAKATSTASHPTPAAPSASLRRGLADGAGIIGCAVTQLMHF